MNKQKTNFKKSTLTILTCIVLLLCILTGCGREKVDIPHVDIHPIAEEKDNLLTPQNSVSLLEEVSDDKETESPNVEEPEELRASEENTTPDAPEETQEPEPTPEETVEPVEEATIEPTESPTPEVAPPQGPIVAPNIDKDCFVVYFSGIDVWGWTDTKSRSDVNILAAVNTRTRQVQLINTPRDYYVQMPISTDLKDKLTHAGLYGVENSMGTLANLYGVNIDYYVRMNFSGFEAIINAVGGVDVYSEQEFTVDPIKHYVKGYNHLNGLEALAFVRERKSFVDGDNQRGRNQMAMVQAMAKKACSPEFLMNYPAIMEQLTDMFRTNMPTELIASLVANQMVDGREWTVQTFAVTGSNGKERTYSTPNSKSYVMIPNESDINTAKELIGRVLNG